MDANNISRSERRQLRKLWFNRVLTVILSFAMVMSSTPIPAGAADEMAGSAETQVAAELPAEPAAQAEDAAAEAQTQAASEAQTQTADAAAEGSASEPAQAAETNLVLNLQHAHIVVYGQTVTDILSSLTVPTDADFTFEAAADKGYNVTEVYTSRDGQTTTLGTADGTYTIPADELSQGVALCVATEELPQEAEQSAPTPLAEKSAAQVEATTEAETTAEPEAAAKPEATAEPAPAAKPEATAEPAATAKPEAAADSTSSTTAEPTPAPTKTTYAYEDDQVSVTATLQDPTAVPDNAQFKVAPVTQQSAGYNYGAYMDALNQTAGDDPSQAYTQENTLLYDVAFMVPKTDAEGKAVEGEWVEYEPTAGSVDIQINFKQSQLTQAISASEPTDVEVKHLPLTDSKRQSVDSTADATDISAGDVQVQDVQKADVTTEGQEAVTITTDSLSVMAFSVRKAPDNTQYVEDDFMSIEQLVGDARYYGIVADTWQVSDAETNAAVKQILKPTQQSGNDLTAGANANKQPWVIGEVVGGTLNIKGVEADIYAPKSEFPHICPSQTARLYDMSKEDVDAFVDHLKGQASGIGNRVNNQSFSTKLDAQGKNATGEITSNNGEITLDITDKPAGTYYVNAEDIYANLKYVKKNDNQVIFFNFPTATDVNMHKIEYQPWPSDNAGEDVVSSTVVWNMPSATSVTINGQNFGTFYMPNADLHIDDGYNSGRIIAKTVENDGGKEFHFVWQHVTDYPKPTTVKTNIEAGKLLDSAAPGNAYAGAFSFQLKDAAGNVLQTKTADASGAVTFDPIEYNENIDWNNGTKVPDENYYQKVYTYTVSEVIPGGATDNGDGTYTSGKIVYDGTPKTVTVTVTDYFSDGHKSLYVQIDDAALTFSNRTTDAKVGSLKVTKSFAGDLSADTLTDAQKSAITFEVRNSAGQTVRSFTYEDMADGTFTVANLVPGTYTVVETKGSVPGYAATAVYSVEGGAVAVAADQTAEVTVTNTYSKAAQATVEATKTLEGKTLANAQFKFTLSEGDTVLQTKSNDESGKVRFDPMDYSEPGEHDYTIAELNDGQAGYTYDAHTCRAQVSVTRGDDGKLAATVTYPDGTPSFSNTYEGRSPSVNLKAFKTLEGAALTDGEFRFKVYTSWGAPVKTPAGQDVVATNDANGNVTFPAFSFKDNNWAKKYKIVEENTREDGVTYDTTAYYAQITTDYDQQALDNVVTSLKYYSDEDCTDEITGVPTFTNKKESKSGSLTVSKMVDGQVPGEGKTFTFRLARYTDATFATKAEGDDLTFQTSGPSGTYTFATLPAQTEYYKLTEDPAEGYAPNSTAYYVQVDSQGVHVYSDAGRTAPVDGNASYANTSYKSTTASIPVAKALTVPDGLTGPASWSFTVTLSAEGEAPLPTSGNTVTLSKGSQTGSFGPITYTQPGTYTYKLTESGTVAGVTNDPAEKTVTVKVSDDGNGKLNAVVTGATPTEADASNTTLTNTYTATEAKASIPVSKVVDVPAGLTGPKDWSFTATLSADKGVPMPAAEGQTVMLTKANPSATFGQITYTAPGTYTYKVTESGTVAGVTNDASAEKTVTLKVSDDGNGKLNAVVTGATPTSSDPSSTTFTNTYGVGGSFGLTAQKALSTGATPEKDAYTFQLKDQSGKVVDTKTNDATGAVTFAQIPLTAADANTTRTYTIHESSTAAAGWANAADQSVKVNIGADKGDGTLNVTYTYNGQTTDVAPAVQMVNTYDASGSWNISGTKTFSNSLNGQAESLAGRNFSVILKDATEGASSDAVTATVTDQGTFSLSKSYRLGDLGGETSKDFTYDLREVIPAGAKNLGDGKWQKGDVIYDASIYTIVVHVTDNGSGTLTTQVVSAKKGLQPNSGTEVDIKDGTFAPTFANTYDYKASGSFTLTANKTLNGTVPASGEFEFKVEPQNGAPFKDVSGNDLPQTASNDAQGAVTFGTIAFTQENIGHTYEYVISETGNDRSVTYASPLTVKLTVGDAGNGRITVTPTYKRDGQAVEAAAFANTSTTTASIPVQKVVSVPEGLVGPKNWSFTATLSAGKGVPMPAAGGQTVTLTQANPSAAFGQITYSKPGTYTYTVTESDTVSGVTNDAAKTVTVNVTKDATGHLTAEVRGADSTATTPTSNTTLTNTYSARETTASIPVTKVVATNPAGLTGPSDWSFSATLSANNGAPLPEQKTVTLTKAAPTQSFGQITFNQPGTYSYKVTESGTVAGVTNDASAEKTVTVNVTDDGSGKLTATVLGADGNQSASTTFTNTYNYGAAGFSVSGTKTLTGRDMADGEFSVSLYQADENYQVTNQTPVATAQISDGTYTISSEVKTAGSHYYVLKEDVDSKKPGITYDTTAYRVKVDAADNGQGGFAITTTVTKPDGGAVTSADFSNAYKQENTNVTTTEDNTVTTTSDTTSAGKTAKTGDTTDYTPVAVLAVIGVALVAFALWRKKKGEAEQSAEDAASASDDADSSEPKE